MYKKKKTVTWNILVNPGENVCFCAQCPLKIYSWDEVMVVRAAATFCDFIAHESERVWVGVAWPEI